MNRSTPANPAWPDSLVEPHAQTVHAARHIASRYNVGRAESAGSRQSPARKSTHAAAIDQSLSMRARRRWRLALLLLLLLQTLLLLLLLLQTLLLLLLLQTLLLLLLL
jgi:hypothetical protein